MWNIIKSKVKEGICSKCDKHKYVVKVVNKKTGETQWRCNNCVRRLKNGGREFAHYKLTPKEIEALRKGLRKRNQENRLSYFKLALLVLL